MYYIEINSNIQLIDTDFTFFSKKFCLYLSFLMENGNYDVHDFLDEVAGAPKPSENEAKTYKITFKPGDSR